MEGKELIKIYGEFKENCIAEGIFNLDEIWFLFDKKLEELKR